MTGYTLFQIEHNQSVKATRSSYATIIVHLPPQIKIHRHLKHRTFSSLDVCWSWYALASYSTWTGGAENVSSSY